jgi:hypothetical protein
MKKILFLVFVMLSCTCCTTRYSKVNQTITNFFQAVNTDNEKEMLRNYPFTTLMGWVYPDGIKVGDNWELTDIKKTGKDSLAVSVVLSRGSRWGDEEVVPIILYMTKASDPIEISTLEFEASESEPGVVYTHMIPVATIPPGQYIIYDSEHLFSFDVKLGQYAENIGCLTPVDSTDVAILTKLEYAKKILEKEVERINSEIKSGFVIISETATKEYYSVSGRGTCKNKSGHVVVSPRYKVSYFDRDDNLIETEEGRIASYLESGASKKFSWTTLFTKSELSELYTYRVELEFDESANYEAILNGSYTGTEYKTFLEKYNL